MTARIVSRMGKALTGGGTTDSVVGMRDLERRIVESERRAQEAETRSKASSDQVNALRSQIGDLRKAAGGKEEISGTLNKRACFKCGSLDHQVQDCPLNNKSKGKAPEGGTSKDDTKKDE